MDVNVSLVCAILVRSLLDMQQVFHTQESYESGLVGFELCEMVLELPLFPAPGLRQTAVSFPLEPLQPDA